MKVVLLSDIQVQATHPSQEVMRPNFLWGLCSLMSRHEFVHIGPALVSACESAPDGFGSTTEEMFWAPTLSLLPYQHLSGLEICRRTLVAFAVVSDRYSTNS